MTTVRPTDRKSDNLTERRIREAKPRPKTWILWDVQVRGLGVRITPAGVKSYILNFRVGGRERRATLARASELSLKAARERAGQELAAIRAGEADPLERRRNAKAAQTVADLIRKFLTTEGPARIQRGRMTQRTLSEYRRQCERYILPAIGKMNVEAVGRGHIERMVAALAPVTRNRVLALASRLFSLAEVWELRTSNPVRGIERAREEARDRVLSPAELAKLAAVLNDFEDRYPASVAAIRTAALTGLRIGEVLAIRWEHVDFETGRLTLPETKTGRRQHDLPTAALEILSAFPRINAWAFTTGSDAPVTYRTVRKHFADAAKEAGIDDVRIHDLRRTVMTNAAMAGVGTHVLRDLLGHKTAMMADRYIRAVGSPVRDAREQVGTAMATMMAGKGGNVVPLRGRRRG